MPRARRDWSRLSWSLLIIVLGLAAAVACGSHPPSHDHDVGHPPLCTHTNNPATLAHAKPLVFLDGGTFPLSPKSLFPLVSLPALNAQVFVDLLVLPAALSQSDARKSVSPPMFLVVLRQ
jgi:hypothetical protein